MRSKADLYREIRVLSSRMVETARAGDWEGFAVVQRGVRELRDDLQSSRESRPVAASDMDQCRCLIQHILEDDAEVRRFTEPWLEKLWVELGTGDGSAPSRRKIGPRRGRQQPDRPS